MIKTVLKHWIYEACIDVLFEKILNNFITPFTISKLKHGDIFSKLVFRNTLLGTNAYTTCINVFIISIDDERVYFSYDYDPEIRGTFNEPFNNIVRLEK